MSTSRAQRNVCPVEDFRQTLELRQEFESHIMEEELSTLCERLNARPGRNAVAVKAGMIATAFGTNVDQSLEKYHTKPKGQTLASIMSTRTRNPNRPPMAELVDVLHDNADTVSGIVDRLRALGPPTDPEIEQSVITEVTTLNALIRDSRITLPKRRDQMVKDGETGRSTVPPEARRSVLSFCSKYLHCHAPSSVIILDNRAWDGMKKVIREVRACDPNADIPFPQGNAEERYDAYVHSFGPLYRWFAQHVTQGEGGLTVKSLDTHLYLRGGGSIA